MIIICSKDNNSEQQRPQSFISPNGRTATNIIKLINKMQDAANEK